MHADLAILLRGDFQDSLLSVLPCHLDILRIVFSKQCAFGLLFLRGGVRPIHFPACPNPWWAHMLV